MGSNPNAGTLFKVRLEKEYKMKYISRKNLPARMPLNESLIYWLLCREFELSGFALGILVTILALWWLAYIVSVFTSEHVDMFEKD